MIFNSSTITYMSLNEIFYLFFFFFVDMNICLRATEVLLKSIMYELLPSDW